MQDKFLPFIGACEVPNWTIQSKTKAGITKCNQKREQSMPKLIGHNIFF